MLTIRAASTPSRKVMMKASSMGGGDLYDYENEFQLYKDSRRAPPPSTREVTRACDLNHIAGNRSPADCAERASPGSGWNGEAVEREASVSPAMESTKCGAAELCRLPQFDRISLRVMQASEAPNVGI